MYFPVATAGRMRADSAEQRHVGEVAHLDRVSVWHPFLAGIRGMTGDDLSE